MHTIPNANLLAKTLLIVSSASLARKPSHCARLLLLAHNPCIATGRHKDVIWNVSSIVTVSVVLYKDSLYIHSFVDGMIGTQTQWFSASQGSCFSRSVFLLLCSFPCYVFGSCFSRFTYPWFSVESFS